MEKQTHTTKHTNQTILPSGDANTAFHRWTPAEILSQYGPPTYLLSSSSKTKKCLSVDVLARALYFTPGIFCPSATSGCLRACLGHTSGRMQMPTHAAARDRRTAHYIENPSLFMARLKLELAEHCQEASRLNLRPAVRLNGTSDLPWETLHPEVFSDLPQLDFFDYTKVVSRMENYIGGLPNGRSWPKNYYLTFSATPNNHEQCRRVLDQGRNVAVVFWPEVPSSHWGFPVIDGDTHDARFLDPGGVIVGLKAKGLAQVDLSGFTIRPCSNCGPSASELRLRFAFQNTHRTTVHECPRCGFEIRQRHAIPQGVQKRSMDAISRRSSIGRCQDHPRAASRAETRLQPQCQARSRQPQLSAA